MSFEFGAELEELGDTECYCCICGKCSTEWPSVMGAQGEVRAKENITFRNAKSRKHRKLQSFKKFLYLNELPSAGEQKDRVELGDYVRAPESWEVQEVQGEDLGGGI